MNFKVMVNGETFVSRDWDQETLKDHEQWIYLHIACANQYRITCRDGRVVILTQTALKSAIFIFDYNKV